MSALRVAVRNRHNKEIAMRVVRAAGVQLSPVLYSRNGTVDKVVQKGP